MSWPAKLLPWLRRMFFEKHEENMLTKLELRQLVHGSADTVVNVWEFNEDTPKISVEDFAGEVCQMAQSDCEESFDGPTSYTMLAYFGSEYPIARAPAARFLSHTRSNGDTEETEPPTAKGFAAQQMRHNEALFRMMLVNGEQQRNHDRKIIEMYQARIHHLEGKAIEMNMMVEDMQSRKLEREVFAQVKKDDALRMAEAWESAKVLFPTIVSKLTNGKVALALPDGSTPPTPEEETLDMLIGSITPAQLANLQKILNPQQLIGLSNLFEKRAARDEALAKKRKESLPGVEEHVERPKAKVPHGPS